MTDSNQILHNDKHYQLLFMGGPKLAPKIFIQIVYNNSCFVCCL